MNRPFLAGMPSAPGKVPKYESNDRFSCMMMITCRILWIPLRDARWGWGAQEARRTAHSTVLSAAAARQRGLRFRYGADLGISW